MNVVKTCDGIVTPEETTEYNETMSAPIEDLACLLTMSAHSSDAGSVPRELNEQDVLSVLDDEDNDDSEGNTNGNNGADDDSEDNNNNSSRVDGNKMDSNEIDVNAGYVEEVALDAVPTPITMRKTRHIRRTSSTSRWLS